jgi:hypothetical protein
VPQLAPGESSKGVVDPSVPESTLFEGSGRATQSGFWAFAEAGKELAALHLDYEKLESYPLKWIETEGVPL